MSVTDNFSIHDSSGDAHSLSYRVFEKLEGDILNGTIAPGDSLVESKVSGAFGVSRTPVREAIRMLEQKGLVRLVPNKGALVLGVDKKDLLDIYTIRSYIEGLASRWAAENITESGCRQLREIVDLQEFYYLKSYGEQISEMDSRFHEAIFALCTSRTLQHMLKDLHHMIQRYRRQSIGREDRTEKAIAEHRQILEAICAGDGQAAEKLTVEHINNAKDNLIKIL